MTHNLVCYFCHQTLSPFKDPNKSENYNCHLVCYNCYQTPHHIPIWEPPYVIIYEKDILYHQYVYFNNIKLWLHVYHNKTAYPNMNWPNEISIKNRDNKCLLSLKYDIEDIFTISPSVLENKIKMWVLFS